MDPRGHGPYRQPAMSVSHVPCICMYVLYPARLLPSRRPLCNTAPSFWWLFARYAKVLRCKEKSQGVKRLEGGGDKRQTTRVDREPQPTKRQDTGRCDDCGYWRYSLWEQCNRNVYPLDRAWTTTTKYLHFLPLPLVTHLIAAVGQVERQLRGIILVVVPPFLFFHRP